MAKFETRAVHDGQEPDELSGAVIPPIHMSSTFRQEAVGIHKGYEYSRTSNPTRENLEKQIASLESAKESVAFSSGSAATATIQLMLKSGSHVICGDDVYGGTYRFFDKVMKNFNVSYDFVNLTNPENLTDKITENTELLWLESPTNPLLKISDLQTLTKIAREYDILTVVDNTFATPFLQQPFSLGADMVVHSSTKYLGGHSDLVGGVVVSNDEIILDKLKFLQNSVGAVPSPFDSWLLSRGIKTLSLRMERHCSNARAIINYLQEVNHVKKIYYPFLDDHPNANVARKQMKMGGGIISFEVENQEKANRFLKNLHLFYLAESLGGVESLAEFPPLMTHGSIEKEIRKKIGINDGLIRLSVGIEHVDDLIADLEQSFQTL